MHTPVQRAFCAFCGHYESYHATIITGDKTEHRCRAHTGVGSSCNCKGFCNGYVPKSSDGLQCENCDQDFFVHDDMERNIDRRLMGNDTFLASITDDVRYNIAMKDMSRCCLWTVYQFFKRGEKLLPLGLEDTITCPNCFSDMVVDAIDNGIPLIKAVPVLLTTKNEVAYD